MVELKQSTGWNPAKQCFQKHDQDKILVDGRKVGILPHHDRAKVLMLRAVSEAEASEIMEAVVSKRGKELPVVPPPPDIPEDYYHG